MDFGKLCPKTIYDDKIEILGELTETWGEKFTTLYRNTNKKIYILGGEKFTILYRNANKILGELKETLGGGGGGKITTF
jgi:hypothetical protein